MTVWYQWSMQQLSSMEMLMGLGAWDCFQVVFVACTQPHSFARVHLTAFIIWDALRGEMFKEEKVMSWKKLILTRNTLLLKIKGSVISATQCHLSTATKYRGCLHALHALQSLSGSAGSDTLSTDRPPCGTKGHDSLREAQDPPGDEQFLGAAATQCEQ